MGKVFFERVAIVAIALAAMSMATGAQEKGDMAAGANFAGGI